MAGSIHALDLTPYSWAAQGFLVTSFHTPFALFIKKIMHSENESGSNLKH